MPSNRTVFELSTKSIIKVVMIVLGLAFLWLIRDVLGLLLVSIILASAFDPMVDWLQRRKIPRGVGIIIIYIVILSALGGVVYGVSGPIAQEVRQISYNFPAYYHNVVLAWEKFQSFGLESSSSMIKQPVSSLSLPQATTSLFGFVTGVFGSLFTFFLVLVMTFYFTIEEENLRRVVRAFAPSNYHPYLMQLMSKIQTRLGYWLRGWLILSVIIFLFCYAGLTLLGVKYAMVLALMAGAFEIVPFLGPILAAVPAIFLAYQQSPLLAIAVVVLYIVVQQLENNIFVPKVMGKATGINPIIILTAILIGAKVAGVVGALLAVPVATAIAIYFKDFDLPDGKSQTNET